MDDYCNILQIMPATDWLVEYDDSAENVEPVICFALVEVTKEGLNKPAMLPQNASRSALF